MSRSALPTSTRMLAEACARVFQGLPLPRTVTRSSPSSSPSAPGIYISAYCRRGVPTIGVRVIACVPPAKAGIGRDVELLFVIFMLLINLNFSGSQLNKLLRLLECQPGGFTRLIGDKDILDAQHLQAFGVLQLLVHRRVHADQHQRVAMGLQRLRVALQHGD